MKKILIIEDDELIAELESDFLNANNYETKIVQDGITGLKTAKSKEFDLIILDVMLPGMNGFEICKTLRQELDLPIIMVTAKKEDIDKIRGLGMGADDYIVKPFSPSELVARVKAHISIHERLLDKDATGRQDEQDEIIIHNLRILPLQRRVYVDDKEIILANKEYELLFFFVQNPNIVFSKERLFDRVWGMDAVADISTVTVHINRLREKIERDSANPTFIETIWGAGYRFNV